MLALVVRLALWPLSQAQFKSMAEMQKIAPLVKAIQTKYKENPQEMNTRVMALYKEHGVNPFASCLPLLLQLPLLLCLYWAVRGDLDAQWKALGALIGSRHPTRIGIDVSRTWPAADGLTHALHERLVEALPPGYATRLVSAEALVVRWIETLP